MGFDDINGVIDYEDIPNYKHLEVDGDGFVEVRARESPLQGSMNALFNTFIKPLQGHEKFDVFYDRYCKARTVLYQIIEMQDMMNL